MRCRRSLAIWKMATSMCFWAQDCYGWGYKSVQILLDKVVKGKAPAEVKIIDPLTKVTKENVKEFGKMWDKWLGK